MAGKQQRIIPLTQEFMESKTIYDRLWVYLQLNSYIGYDLEKKKHRFIYNDFKSMLGLYNKVVAYDREYAEALNKLSEFKPYICYNTFTKSFSKLQTMNYIVKGKIIDKQKRLVDVYYLKEDFTPYKLIPYETLEFLMRSGKNNIFKVYAQLLNWFSFKKDYRFTIKELTNNIGYTSKEANKQVQNILYYLQYYGLISYGYKTVTTKNGKETSYHILTNTSLTINIPKEQEIPTQAPKEDEFVF